MPANIIIMIAIIKPIIAKGFFSFFLSKAITLKIIVNVMSIYCVTIKNFGYILVKMGCEIKNTPNPNEVNLSKNTFYLSYLNPLAFLK